MFPSAVSPADHGASPAETASSAPHHISFLLWHKVAFVLMAVVSLVYTFFNDSGLRYRVDLEVYRVGAQRVLDSQELYSGAFQITPDVFLPFTYPPISALLFVPLTVGPHDVASILMTIANIAVLFCVTRVLISRFAAVDSPTVLWLSIATTAVLIPIGPIWSTITYGQVNIFLMALIFVDTMILPRRWRGFLTGAAVAIKLTPAVFGLWFLLQRDWASILRMGAGTVGLTGLAWLILPRDSHTYWLDTLSSTGRIGNMDFPANQSFNGALWRAGLRDANSGSWLWLLLVAVTLVVITALMLRLFRAQAPFEALVANSFIALLASPVSWTHHWVWIPLLIIAVTLRVTNPATMGGFTPRMRSFWQIFAGAGFLCFVLEPKAFTPIPEYGGEWNLFWHVVGNSYLWWTVACIVVLWVMYQPQPHHGHTDRDHADRDHAAEQTSPSARPNKG
ncbi:Polyprenol-phosphate-mannose-dependent alpha-(1-2)-phosphatidylinositol mannoside mannosyltransferase [Corynebacterium ciconiae DSM 44920]|uniref:glycosyltransferase 87 family protein n=1 Tax=Corynebacterium ciconiae TaxID=227319 RepID=UPI000361FE22|nr:glycosyltransferase 87 family protein [Corynebacterium ciconiae]WKD62121.1 Polyprenol-phosphate-mannose-dependent alpha-(1-2)-phosphatidylinositol mannoside mannosyltransferase [Corynebacterium ciconiae DSM 44920]